MTTPIDQTMSNVNLDSTAAEIVSFIRKVVDDVGANGAVLGLSGGVDSSLVAALCVKAVGRERVLGVIMPVDFTPTQDVRDAEELASQLGIRTEKVAIDTIVTQFVRCLGIDPAGAKVKIPLANVRCRIRMIILYYFANLQNLLVAGTGDRSEDLIGYFTKYGDGGVDFLPISHLYKGQVRRLAKHLGVPEKIAYKPSSPQLYPGHKATDEIPVDYEKLDPIEIALFDQKLPHETVGNKLKVPVEVVAEVARLYERSKHKRLYPPMVKEW